jgi:hypothetical protein
MNGYFKPLRRKIGVITLGLACVLMAGWVRSMGRYDQLYLVTGTHSDLMVQATDGYLALILTETEHEADALFPFWQTEPFDPDRRFDPSKWEESTKVVFHAPGFGFAIHNRTSTIPFDVKIWFVSYWLSTALVTLFSAWLLFSKPKQQKPSLEQRTDA